MQAHRDLYKNASLLAATGAGVWLLRRRRHAASAQGADHPALQAADHVRRHANLTAHVGALAQLDQPLLLAKVVRLLDDLLRRSRQVEDEGKAASTATKARQVQSVHDLTMDVRAVLHDLLREAKRSRADAVATACVDVAQETMPAIDGILDAILHNVLLDAQP